MEVGSIMESNDSAAEERPSSAVASIGDTLTSHRWTPGISRRHMD